MAGERVAGRRGRLPQRAPGDRFAIDWAHAYMLLPAPTYPIDVSQGITDWGMLGNDTYGDCGPCGYAHDRMLGGGKPTTEEVVKLYLTYDKGQDEGVVIADFLLWLYQQGYIEAFAPVELKSVDAVMQQVGRGIMLGVSLTDDADELFSEGKPWTVANGERPDPNEGHVILKVKAHSSSGPGTAVTWGALEELEYGWEAACEEEAWVILTKDDLSDTGYALLMADLEALPHVVAPTPTPQPTPPAPAPVPTPTPAPPAPGSDPVVDDADRKLAPVLRHLLQHPGFPVHVIGRVRKQAIEAWLADKGL